MARLPLVAIIGRANVGKSTLFNRLVGGRQAITHETPGTTRDRLHGTVSWRGQDFLLVDTAGLKSAENELESRIQSQIEQASSEADLLLVVVDSSSLLTAEDRTAAKLALRTGKPVVLAINKADSTSEPADRIESLGIADKVMVSAIQGQGTGDLLDMVVERIPKATAEEEDTLTIAIMGRPNVGKSTLLNSLLGKQQALTHESAGTTRDVTSGTVRYHGRSVEIMDTAGLRRRGKIEPGIEKFSALRTAAAANAADICLIVMDATEPSVAGDQHIAGQALEAGAGVILVINKWDLVEKDDKSQHRYLARLKADFPFAAWAPVIFTSATTGLNVTQVLELASQIDERRKQKIPTAKLNALITELTANHPPAGMKNRQPKINYVTQTGTEPPAFTFFASYPDMIHFSYKRYLENGLRQAFDFTGTPLILEFRSKR